MGKGVAGKPGVGVTGNRLVAGRHARQIELHHVHPGPNPFKVKPPLGIGLHESAIFQVDADAGNPFGL